MAIDDLVSIVHGNSPWPSSKDDADSKFFDALFGSPSGRYPANARSAVTLRAPQMSPENNVVYAAYIHPLNPNVGPYAGMSIAIFPAPGRPCLLTFVVGTNGISPDDAILGRPGHARNVKALCTWLNQKHGNGKRVAWAKDDPVRIDIGVPDAVTRQFSEYKPVFEKYGNVLYGIYAPTDDEHATREAVAAFLDLMFEERGFDPIASQRAASEQLRSERFQHMLPDVTREDVCQLLESRRYVIIQGPPGTGKTRMATELLRDTYGGHGTSIQFHPNTTYENFIGGLAPAAGDGTLGFRFAPLQGFLMSAAASALAAPDRPFLLHIDEVNRADLAKVLGEAIYLLETDEETARIIDLPYDFGPPWGTRLKLPANLHILGTMNSSDRSLAIVDVAVRRRFAFTKLWPQGRVVSEFGGELMARAFEDLLAIFVDHANDDAFELVPGHSYFLEKDDAEAPQRLRTTLVPLLEEYLKQGYVGGFAEQIRAYLQWIESL